MGEFHNEERHDFYPLPHNSNVVKSRRARGTGNVTQLGRKRNGKCMQNGNRTTSKDVIICEIRLKWEDDNWSSL
jgi:hypothetical protein